jgi:ketosteroid isomerase-like protein
MLRFWVISAIVAASLTTSAFAQEAEVKAAIDAYHAALGSLDISKMEPLWAHEPYVMLVNPRDKSITIGWDAVRKNWETSWQQYLELKVTQADGPHIHVNGDAAWSIGIANATIKPKAGDTITAPTLETDVFVNRGGKWLLVSHVASRVPQ